MDLRRSVSDLVPQQTGGLVALHEVLDDSKRVVEHGLGRASPVLSGMLRKKRSFRFRLKVRVRRQHEFGGAPDCYEAYLSKKSSGQMFEELGQGGDDVSG